MEELFYKNLIGLFPLYERVKSAMLLLENFDEQREMYVAPINQLRSALDHIFNAAIAKEVENCDYELKEAKEHLIRAGYDALELFAGSCGASVCSKLNPYDTETLTNVFPEYFTEVKPKISEIQQIVAQLRMGRKIDSDDTFFSSLDLITDLITINTKVDKRIPALQNYSDIKVKEKKRERFWQYGIGSIIALVFTALGAFLTWLLTK